MAANLDTGEQTGWISRLFRAPRPLRARTPDSSCIYAVGDIHGRLDLLVHLLDRIQDEANPAFRNVLVFVGDYIDRGPDSREVVEHLSTLEMPDWQVVFLRGNHDETLLKFLDDPMVYRNWREYGGAETLLSYGVMPPSFDDKEDFVTAREEFLRGFPASHLDFFRRLEDFHVEGDYMFVHAGVRPGVPLEKQSASDLMWIRNEFLYSDKSFGKMIVHGHTPSERPVRRRNRIGIDTGAFATGCLTAVVLEGENCRFLSAKNVRRAG
jgi:serine/threonine protein phosphatase 1